MNLEPTIFEQTLTLTAFPKAMALPRNPAKSLYWVKSIANCFGPSIALEG